MGIRNRKFIAGYEQTRRDQRFPATWMALSSRSNRPIRPSPEHSARFRFLIGQ